MSTVRNTQAPRKWALGAWVALLFGLAVQALIAYRQIHETMPFYAPGAAPWR